MSAEVEGPFFDRLYLKHVTAQDMPLNTSRMLTVAADFGDHGYTEICLWDGEEIPVHEDAEPLGHIGIFPEDLEPLIDALIRIYDDEFMDKNYTRKEVTEWNK